MGFQMTLIEMLEENVSKYPDKTAIIYKDETFTYRDFGHQSQMLANFLANHGLVKGDRVGLIIKKSPEALISFLGIAMAGGIFYTVDYNQPDDNIHYTIDLTRPAFLIVSAEFKSILKKLESRNLAAKVIVVGDDDNSDYFTWQEAQTFQADLRCDIKIDQHDPVYLNFTSGSTGKPKGAITTHDNLYWNTKSVVKSFAITPSDIHLCGFPIFTHPDELFMRALYTGGTIVLTDDALPNTIASAVSRHKITCMMAVALIYENLVRYQVNPTDLATLRVAESAGMPVSSRLVEDFKERFNITITAAWGSTETKGIALANPVSKTKPESMGKPCPYYDIKVVDEMGQEVGTEEIGEMIIRGPANITGYFDNEQESKNLIKDGWLYTGDMVKKDPQGYFYFVARKNRMIKVAGWKVYPNEIEDVLASHPDVAEAAVTKTDDQTLGEVPRAVVVLKSGAAVTPSDLRRHCAKTLAKYKVPTVIDIVSELPKAPSGKILYQRL